MTRYKKPFVARELWEDYHGDKKGTWVVETADGMSEIYNGLNEPKAKAKALHLNRTFQSIIAWPSLFKYIIPMKEYLEANHLTK